MTVLFHPPAEMTTRSTEPLAAFLGRSVQLAVFHSSSNLSNHSCILAQHNYSALPSGTNKPNFRVHVEQVANSKAWQQYIENDPLFYHGGYKFGAAQVFNISYSIICWLEMKWKQVVMNSMDWAVGHMEDLRMPLLILHGIDDKLSLLSGSRWL